MQSNSISANGTAATATPTTWHIFPCHYNRDGSCSCGSKDCGSPAKHPLPIDGLKAATNDSQRLDKWWSVNPQANIGVATGEINNLVVVDIDADHGGFETLLEIEEKYGRFPETVEARTGSGGLHLYFRYPQGERIGSKNGWMQGIDVKANGGYVLSPPSRNLNGDYRWELGCSPAEAEIAEIPPWLLPLLPRQSVEQEKPSNGKPVGEHEYTIHADVSLLHRAKCYVAKADNAIEGNRNHAAFNLAGNVYAIDDNGTRLSEATILELLATWNERNHPPLSVEELRQCVASALVNGTPREAKEATTTNVVAKESDKGLIEYTRITSAELATGDYSIDYLIEHSLVAGQPLIIAGPQKTLKTSLLIDAAISLATARYFLGKLKANRQCRVAVMSGECGLATIQETARRVCDAAGQNLADLENIVWSPSIPKFGSAPHLEALDKFLADDGIEVLLVDPAYLAMPSNDAGNLMAQGELLRGMNELCHRRGVTLGLCHHTKRNTGRDPYEPLELQDIAWAGFAEFARQWWLLNRREKYEPGSGEHRLWLSAGGSAGHSALWALDVSEGNIADPGGRHWQVELSKPDEARKESERRREQSKGEAKAKQIDADMRAIVRAIADLPDKTGTKTDIHGASSINSGRFRPAFAALLRNQSLVSTHITKSNGQTYDAYQLANEKI